MAKKNTAAAADTTFNMTALVDAGIAAAPEDAVLAGLLEELETSDPTVGDAADEIIEAGGAEAADDLLDSITAEAADAIDTSAGDALWNEAMGKTDDAALILADADDVVDVDAKVVLSGADDMNLDALLEEVTAQPAAAASVDAVDDLLDDVAGEAARIEAKQELYAEQGATTAGEGEDAPQTDADAVVTTKKPRAKKDAAPKEPKPPRVSSVTHKPGDLLLAKLGTKAGDYLIFDADPAKNETMHATFIERMNDRDAIADKVRDKIIMLVTWLASGNPAGLNEVLRRTFALLAKDGQLSSGDKGNLQLDLLAKPYSIGTARSQANQMFMCLPELGLCAKTKGVMVANPDSIMLQAINAQLGL